ncbi:MAG: DNA primase, partial [Candidatus Magasanikbacteria bacterium]|nr:DNA primase [Candidatus Magasanikbacteria bacterium]
NMQPSEEIKAKLDIVDVIRDYVPLKPAGVNFRACCPFHREKSPSFVVSPEKQIFHCFGCGKGGDIFSFVTQIEGIEFVEALRMLAQKAGVTLQRIDPKINSEKNKVLDIIDLSRKYFHHILRNNKEAQAARDYLKKRGLKDETIDEWQIGYSLDSWDGLLQALLARGYKEAEILKSGMIIKKENTNKHYDRFRDRIMFPINDVNGSTVAFTARINPAKEATDKMGKYINSPQTMVYDKSKILFGLDRAKLEIKANDSVIITEGQMDVISSHQAGFKNVVASSGTALTTEQIILIKRFTNNISLAFDHDAAGAMAADRGIKEAMQADMNIKVIEIPNGKDPDECIKNNPADFERAVKNAKAMMQYYFDITLEKLNVEELEGKREAVKKL